MSDITSFARPKVRFCQTDTSKSIPKELQNSTDQKIVQQQDKPKILSIVSLNKPVKLVKLNETSSNRGNKVSKIVDNASDTNSLTLCANVLPPSTNQSPSVLNENHIKTEDRTPLNDANNIQNIKANSKEADVPKTSTKLLSNDVIVSTDFPIEQTVNLKEASKSKTHHKTNSLKKDCTNGREAKKNKAIVIKRDNKTATTKTLDSDILKHRNRLCSAKTSIKKSNVTNKASISVTTKRNLSSKSVDLMPCYKYNKVTSKTKTSPVKKTLIRDIIGSKIEAYIGPGVLHKQPDDLKTPETDENTHPKPIISGEKLARPEYNSIMCTINKLNEMKKQKVIADIEHLPSSYKSLLNGKVSTALDFPLDETVYRNLVDLSIDENQLPSRLTRSKDPEPRQKDVVPILSDFFTPLSIEEYCTPVFVKPRTPETVESWSAFRISDQICEWKHILDHV